MSKIKSKLPLYIVYYYILCNNTTKNNQQSTIKIEHQTMNLELNIQNRMDELRLEIANTKELYLKAAKVLFMEYHETPSPNRLYQLIKKGSMTTVVEVIKIFWQNIHTEMQHKMHIPNIPNNLQDITQSYVNNIWSQALNEARKEFEQQKDVLKNQIESLQQYNEVFKQKNDELQNKYNEILEQKNMQMQEINTKNNILAEQNHELIQVKQQQHTLYERAAELQTLINQQHVNFAQEKTTLQYQFEQSYQALQNDIKMWQQRLDNERSYIKQQEKIHYTALQKLNANILNLHQNIKDEQNKHAEIQSDYDSLQKEYAIAKNKIIDKDNIIHTIKLRQNKLQYKPNTNPNEHVNVNKKMKQNLITKTNKKKLNKSKIN